MSVLVYVENIDGKLKKSSFEVVSYAKAVANQLQTKLIAISIGDVAENLLQELGKYGVEIVLNTNQNCFKTFVNQAYASVIHEAALRYNAQLVVLSNSFSGKGLAPRIAVKLEAGLADGATELPKIDGEKFLVKKTSFSGKAFSLVELNTTKKVISLNPNAYKIEENPVSTSISTFEYTPNNQDFGTLVKDIIRATDKISLPDAELVVSAGRGLKGPENWKMIEELASLLGAATACSKPVSDAGWRPHSEHVGQTGIAISPNLYIAIGISGAIQHLAGVSSSKVIVVINNDPEAPFFKVADYGIVGDAFQVVPQLIEAIKAHKTSI